MLPRLLFPLALLASTARTFAGAFDHQPALSAAELQVFSQATGFGGATQNFSYEGHEVTLVTRSYTSGTRSSDLHVFICTKDNHYFEVLTRAPIWGSHLTFSQDGDTIHVITEPQRRVLLDLTVSGCFNP